MIHGFGGGRKKPRPDEELLMGVVQHKLAPDELKNHLVLQAVHPQVAWRMPAPRPC